MTQMITSAHTKPAFSLIDTHCHLDCTPLCDNLPRLLSSAETAGISGCVVPGINPEKWDRIARIAGMYKNIYPAYGIHPMHADLASQEMLARLESIALQGVAIGEIGLDPSYPVPLEQQERAFRNQLKIAARCALPVLVHCRRSFQRTLQIMQEEQAGRFGGIMHAFSGSPEMAREFIRLGFAISICGTVTWGNAVRAGKLAAELPLNSLVLETDSPDMSPEPFRNRPNQPDRLPLILAALARLRGISPKELAPIILQNTLRVLCRIGVA